MHRSHSQAGGGQCTARRCLDFCRHSVHSRRHGVQRRRTPQAVRVIPGLFSIQGWQRPQEKAQTIRQQAAPQQHLLAVEPGGHAARVMGHGAEPLDRRRPGQASAASELAPPEHRRPGRPSGCTFSSHADASTQSSFSCGLWHAAQPLHRAPRPAVVHRRLLRQWRLVLRHRRICTHGFSPRCCLVHSSPS